MTTSRRRCPQHHLFPRCPGCDAERKPSGTFPQLEVPPGTAEWLRNAAKWFVTEGDDGAVEFVAWVSVDLREVA